MDFGYCHLCGYTHTHTQTDKRCCWCSYLSWLWVSQGPDGIVGWSSDTVVVSEVRDVQIGGTDGLSPEPSADLSDDQSSEDPPQKKHMITGSTESRHCDLSWLSEDSIYYTRLHYKHMMCFTHRTTFIRAWQAKHWMYQTECKDTHLMFPKTSFTGSAAVNAVWMLNPKKTMKESSF